MTAEEPSSRSDGFESLFDDLVERSLHSIIEEMAEAELSEEELEDSAQRVADAVPEGLRAGVPELTNALKRNAPQMLEARRQARGAYAQMIYEHWSKAFDLYELVLRIAAELGDDFSRIRVGKPADSAVGPVVARLQGRGCRIAEEVLVLMRAGYAQGALARWRALHEVSVVASFISKHGDEAARRYLAHQAVERHWSVQDYIRCQPGHGYEPLEPEAIEAAEAEFKAVLAEFGPTFKRQYGWAEFVIAEDAELKRIRGLAAMEKDVDLDHLRAHYRLASHPVHPLAAGTISNPDLMPEFKDHVLTGPSPRGMADPGHGALISLTQVTSTLLRLGSGASAIVGMQTLLDLTDEAGEAFLRASQELEELGSEGFGEGRKD